MDIEALQKQAVEYNLFFTSLSYNVPSFVVDHGNSTQNPKYIFNRNGSEIASYKKETGNPRAGKRAGAEATSMNDADSDEEEDVAPTPKRDRDVNPIFDSNNQIPSPHANTSPADADAYDVGFGAPLYFTSPDLLQERLRQKIRDNADALHLDSDAVRQRKQERKQKEEIRKAKGYKQKTSQTTPLPAPVRKSQQQDVQADNEDSTPAHNSKKQRDTSNAQTPSDNKLVKLQNVMFGSVLSKKSDDDDHNEANPAAKKPTQKAQKKQQLQQLLDFESTVDRLRSEGKADDAEQMVHSRSVDTALARALGETVNDNIRSLKNDLKKDERAKAKSAATWKRRESTQKQQQKESQDSRNLHIQKKIDHKKGKRLALQEKRKGGI